MSSVARTQCCGYVQSETDSIIRWNPYNGVVQCHNCGTMYVPVLPDAASISGYQEVRRANDKLKSKLAKDKNE